VTQFADDEQRGESAQSLAERLGNQLRKQETARLTCLSLE